MDTKKLEDLPKEDGEIEKGMRREAAIQDEIDETQGLGQPDHARHGDGDEQERPEQEADDVTIATAHGAAL